MDQQDELNFAFRSDLEACREVQSLQDLGSLLDTLQSYGDGEDEIHILRKSSPLALLGIEDSSAV